MKSAGSIGIFLTLISNAAMLDLSKFWLVNQTPTVMEPARPIEIVRWRQPVCLMPAKGVSPCYLELEKLQHEYGSVGGHLQEAHLRSSVSSQPPSSNLATLQSSKGFDEAIGRSQSRTPELKKVTIEERRFLGISGETTPKPQQIYVTRVLNAPMTATLVAHTCLPDVGIPLCRDYQPVQPSKPVFDSQPAPSAETGNPTIANNPSNCQNPNVHQGFSDPVVKPIPTRRPIQRLESSLGQAVCHSCVQSVASGKLGHIVISRPEADVEERPHAIGGSPFHYFDSASPDQQIRTELNIQLSKNSGSRIEGQAVDERPSRIEGQEPEVESPEENKTTIFQNFLHRPDHQEGSSEGSAFLGNIVRPINLFNRKNESTISRPESSTQNSSVSSTSDTEETRNASGIEIMKKPAIMDILHKPENNISNSRGLLDIFESARPVGNADAESLAKPTENPGLLGDLFANPVGPIEAENGKVEAEGN